MKINKIYEKLRSGTATEKEIAFIREEAAKLRRLNEMIDLFGDENGEAKPASALSDAAEPKLAVADIETVRRARKAFNSRLFWRIVILSVCSLLAVAALVCGIIFIPSISSAKRNELVQRDSAVELAKDCLAGYVDDVNKYYIHDIDKNLKINGHLTDAFYIYEIEFRNYDNGAEYEITVNARSGYTMLTDVELRH